MKLLLLLIAIMFTGCNKYVNFYDVYQGGVKIDSVNREYENNECSNNSYTSSGSYYKFVFCKEIK